MTAPNKTDLSVSRWSIAIGLLMILVGLVAMALPRLAGLTATTIVAWVLLFGGACHLAFAWAMRGLGGAYWQVLVALLYGGVGIYLLGHLGPGLIAFTLLFAIYLVAEGTLELLLAFVMGPTRGRGWIALDGAITLILGALIWSWWPTDTGWVLGTVVGISILSSGVARLMLAMALRARTKDDSASSGNESSTVKQAPVF